MNQPSLLDWRPPPPPKRAARAGGRAVDPRLRRELLELVRGRHGGKARAATWEQLRDELVAGGLEVRVVRRLQEAAEELRQGGEPVVGLSGDGVFYALGVQELDEAINEAAKRARKSLRHRRQLRAIRLRMLGQARLEEGQAA